MDSYGTSWEENPSQTVDHFFLFDLLMGILRFAMFSLRKWKWHCPTTVGPFFHSDNIISKNTIFDFRLLTKSFIYIN